MALPIEGTRLRLQALAYVIKLYQELTAENGAPTLGTPFGVRYSRGRRSEFGGRRGGTVPFTMFGANRRPTALPFFEFPEAIGTSVPFMTIFGTVEVYHAQRPRCGRHSGVQYARLAHRFTQPHSSPYSPFPTLVRPAIHKVSAGLSSFDNTRRMRWTPIVRQPEPSSKV